MVELLVLGISPQEADKPPYVLLLPYGTRRVISLSVDPLEAFAVSSMLHGEGRAAERGVFSSFFPSAPTTGAQPGIHDFILSVFEAVGAQFVNASLFGGHGGGLYCEIVFSHSRGESRVPCRPADGIALALRFGGKIFASERVAAEAENIEPVLERLPEHIRALVAARLAHMHFAESGKGFEDISEAIEAALTAKAESTGKDPRRELISVARQMLREERATKENVRDADDADRLEELFAALEKRAGQRASHDFGSGPLAASGKLSTPAHGKPSASGKPRTPGVNISIPQIKVALVRQKNKGNAEILEEFHIPGTGMPEGVLSSLGLTEREAEAVKHASDDERWATLLRILSPETKVPM